ncbi:DUF1801 domain-containing protein [Sphingomicrobium clamense]|uniref:DUF1801 domain-containing protein n=1 Tax=Sphingomicrobium clamense TaxID=2851013 RepID=A0ABS6V501_9SPHN|nr:DUF1801 domain-containing protein [Sphingomicrobium sp. B8]MBW0144277.1 DUF1801 domain-containing protein [Sphingomicrobium sp. B8]
MQTAGDRNAASVADYIDSVDDKRRETFRAVVEKMRALVPDGYDEAMTWGFPTWEVPLEVSGPTYNKKPLMFAAVAAQKRHIGLYIMCAYMNEERKAALLDAHAKAGKKLDMGKSCIRFQQMDDIEWDAVADAIDIGPEEFAEAAIAEREAALGKGKRA